MATASSRCGRQRSEAEMKSESLARAEKSAISLLTLASCAEKATGTQVANGLIGSVRNQKTFEVAE
jgi:hypothetical protein